MPNLETKVDIIGSCSILLAGVSSVYREVHLHWQMFSNEDLELAAYVKAHSEKDAIFLTSDKHNHPIPCLAGRRILMGYRGWLWSHGIDYRSRESDVFEIYEGSPRLAELLKQYDVSYLLLEWDKLAAFHENPAALLGRFPVVYQSRNYILFKVR